MGYEVTRFSGTVDEELICSICSGVLEDPVQAPQCEHAFCSVCIKEWLTRQSTCPVDRNAITVAQLKSVPRILRNLLSKLTISCDYESSGCASKVKLEVLSTHVQDCEHNPKKPVTCEQGCGLVIPKDALNDHNCVHDLRLLVQAQQEKLTGTNQVVGEHKLLIDELKREIHLLKEYMRAMRMADPRVRELQSEMENDEVVRWGLAQQTARVTRWGGMISTPDAVLQAVIKRALIDSGCPSHIVNDLMENAHERRWPPGLSTLETRQLSRRQYENYVTKRIPGKQAVVVMACENQHMSDDMILEPGLVLIFAHGVE